MSQPGHNRFLVVLILGSLCTISPFSIDMYLPAFPEIAAALHTSTAKISLSVSSYFAGLAVGQLVYGPLLDRFGRKRPLYIGLGIFIAASLCCALSNDVRWLSVWRFVQAFGGCAAQIGAMAMVRDFFPVRDTARIISLLILILGVSPLLAPTVGGFISSHYGWKWVFIVLAAVALMNVGILFWYLPEGHEPDPTVSLTLAPIFRNYLEVLKEPQFVTFAVSGAFAFSGLLVYVTGSPIIFMEVFHVSPRAFGIIFASLAIGFIGSNQINVWLLRKFSSEGIYRATLWIECPAALILLVGTVLGAFGLEMTLVLLFVALTSLGLAFPNASALALAPFDHNIGSASAMVGFVQIAISGLASASIGAFDSHGMLPVVIILGVASWIGLGVYYLGRRMTPQLKFVEEKGAHPIH